MIRINCPTLTCNCEKCGAPGTQGKFLAHQYGGRGRIYFFCPDCGLPPPRVVRVVVHGRQIGKRAGYRR